MSLSTHRKPEVRKTQWAWTSFDLSDDFTQHIANEVSRPDCSVYLCYQREVCPDSGRLHLQGFVCFKVRHTRGAVKSLFKNDALHCDPAKYTVAAIDYCFKLESRQYPDQEPRTYGLRSDVPILPLVGGARSDLAIVAAAVVSGESIRSIALRQPEIFVRNHRGLSALHEHVAQPSCKVFIPKTVYWFHGPTGTGKTRRAVAEALDLTDDSKIYFKTPGPWWDGMNDPDVVIMDDFRASWFPFAQLLNFLDGYQILVPVKGGFTLLRPKFIYITSAKPPEELYCALEERTEGSVAQLIRRITQVVRFDDDEPVVPALAPIFNPQKRPRSPSSSPPQWPPAKNCRPRSDSDLSLDLSDEP